MPIRARKRAKAAHILGQRKMLQTSNLSPRGQQQTRRPTRSRLGAPPPCAAHPSALAIRVCAPRGFCNHATGLLASSFCSSNTEAGHCMAGSARSGARGAPAQEEDRSRVGERGRDGPPTALCARRRRRAPAAGTPPCSRVRCRPAERFSALRVLPLLGRTAWAPMMRTAPP